MIYNVKNDFVQIDVTAGTIQNNSYVYPVEISNQTIANSGVLLYPLNKVSFSGDTKLYMRCVDGGAWAEIRVVPFTLDFGVAQGGGSSSTEISLDTQANNIIQDGWNSNYTADDDTNALVASMMTDTTPIDTGDGWSDYLNDLFNKP